MSVWLWYALTTFVLIRGCRRLRYFYGLRAWGPCLYWLLTLVGGTLNFIVILCNGNRMPVEDWTGPAITDGLHRLATNQDHLMLLADVHHLGSARYSLGDVFIVAAVALWLLLKFKNRSRA